MPALLGRERETAALYDLVDRVHEHGGALLITGEAGIGKSALIEAAKLRARAGGMRVLTTSGVQSEAHLPFAGLHHLLRPILTNVEKLPDRQRDALLAAFGMSDGSAPDIFLIALAALDLLGDAASSAPLLLGVEDVQWLDPPTRDVVTFVGRRLDSDPIVLLLAVRDGCGYEVDGLGLPELRLEGLDEGAATSLLEAQAPDVAPTVRRRLLDAAAGNPLALLELPAALAAEHTGEGALLPDRLPLTARLERAFAARAAELPDTTRKILLVASANDGGILGEVLAAASALHGADLGEEDLAPAIAARLANVAGMELRFHHPLVRSAIYQAAAPGERHAAHAALAEILTDQADRRVWHRAAASIGPDEGVASELETAATRAQQRGATAVAVAALERAANLSDRLVQRGRRLLGAAELAFELGRRDIVARLLREAEPLGLGPREQTQMTWLREIFDDGIETHASGVHALVEVADGARAAEDADLALKLLGGAGIRCWWADLGEEVRDRVLAVAERVDVDLDDPRLLAVLAWVAPIARGEVVLDRLTRAASEGHGDAGATRLYGLAASAIGDHELAAGFLAASVAGLRAQARLGLLAQALVLRSWSALHLGNWKLAMPDAEEGGRLARETSQPFWAARARAAEAMGAGLRGRDDAEALAAEAEETALPTRASALLSDVQMARGLTALGSGRYADAYDDLHRMFDPADPSHHYMKTGWAIGDLAEAAVHSGHRDTACALMDELEGVATRSLSPRLRVAMWHARPLLADDHDAEALFASALRVDMTRWPFARARMLLAYGEWLRRQRRTSESRGPLRAARDACDALGTIPWSERARQELRASGETSGRRTPAAWQRLTPQELQIAQMAAEGLSNREIGQRVYLSHRTVGSHLYRIFPKLGITSRYDLRDALDEISSTA